MNTFLNLHLPPPPTSPLSTSSRLPSSPSLQTEKGWLLAGDPLHAKVTVSNGGVLFVGSSSFSSLPLSLPPSLSLAGQNLYINVNVKNNSSRIVDYIEITLLEEVVLKAPNSEGVVSYSLCPRSLTHSLISPPLPSPPIPHSLIPLGGSIPSCPRSPLSRRFGLHDRPRSAF